MTRRGFTLVEVMVGLVFAGIVALALTKFMLSQVRFFGHHDALREARSTSRSALNVLMSELRMVEAAGGVVAAGPQAFTVRVPYAFGIVCSSSLGLITVSLLPSDSAMTAGAAFSGYAWRDANTGMYTYVQNGVRLSVGTPSVCTAQGTTTLPRGSVIQLVPGATGAAVGVPIFLYQTVQYRFAPSATVKGELGLWRTEEVTGVTEELVAPFRPSAGFRFYVSGSDTAQAAVPSPLSRIRGVEIVLSGASAAAAPGRSAPEAFDLTSSIFFYNHLD